MAVLAGRGGDWRNIIMKRVTEQGKRPERRYSRQQERRLTAQL